MTSAINPTVPADGSPAVKSQVRTNFATAAAEITALQAATAGITPYLYNGMRNRFINGAMRTYQRGPGNIVATASATTFSRDRWHVRMNAGGAQITLKGVTGSAAVGFNGGQQLLTSVTPGAPAAGAIAVFGQSIEGIHVEDLQWGTANAKTVTLSFWVRGSIAGNYGMSLNNGAAVGSTPTRSYCARYTINVPNVWEYKTITITGDGTGTWSTTIGENGIRVYFDVGCGSTFQTGAGVWTSGEFYGISGNVALTATSSATLDFTGLQFEAGTAASPFEYLYQSFDFFLCQRYYQRVNAVLSGLGTAGGIVGLGVPYSVPMSFSATALTATPLVSPTAVNAGTFVYAPAPTYAYVTAVTPATGSFTFAQTFAVTAELS